MSRIIGMAVTILTASVLCAACSLIQGTSRKTTDKDTETSSETARLLPGTWKIVSVNCDAAGSNCRQYAASRVFVFSDNGELTVNGRKRGTYRVENNNCILETQSKQYTVTVVQIGASRMVTGEPHRTTTEVLNKIK